MSSIKSLTELPSGAERLCTRLISVVPFLGTARIGETMNGSEGGAASGPTIRPAATSFARSADIGPGFSSADLVLALARLV